MSHNSSDNVSMSAKFSDPLSRSQKLYNENPEKQHNKCEEIVSKIFSENKYIKFLIETMDKMGCTINRDFIKCRECPTETGGFYDSKSGITICENNIHVKKVVEETIVHEMIHAYDYCRANINQDNCVHLACSEIRATNLSGECKFTREIGRGHFAFFRHHSDCVRRRSEITLQGIPSCKPKAPLYIDAAWRSCYYDREPFKHVP